MTARRLPDTAPTSAAPTGLLSDVDCDRTRAAGIVLRGLDSPLGPMLAGATPRGLCLLQFGDCHRPARQSTSAARRLEVPVQPSNNAILDLLQAELAEYFAGARRSFSVPLLVDGTDFQQRVWRQLRRIPYGRTCSYHDVAADLGNVKSVRAVGQANKLNRVCIVIPCHRVLNKNGNLGGYSGGLYRKQFLIELERAGSFR